MIPHSNAQATKFDLPVKWVKVNLGSSFIQIALCQVSSSSDFWFWRRYLESFNIHVYEHGGNLGHMT